MLGLRAWSDDLNVVLFEFLEDDTKLAQSCVQLALRAALVHCRPGAITAPEDPVDWAMAEASDNEDDAPDAPPEPELIDTPPAPASARPMSNLERCIALRLVHGAGQR